MENSKGKVFVAMSGGVDSSVTALLLKNEGYEVTGVFMRCFNVDGCQDRDSEDARRVAEKLKIPFYVWDFEEEYKKRVVEYMVDGYRRGLTPNPDVMCNKEIKFGLFFDRAMRMGADYVATGHYVRLGRIAFRKQHNFLPARKFASLSPRHSSLRSEAKLSGLRDVPQDNPAEPLCLFEAKDKNKDQSYFLWTLTQDKLRHCLFPIGDYLKSEVREMARAAGLPTAEKKDSQGICFLGQITLADFLAEYIPEHTGIVLTTKGEKVGEHRGAEFFTIGQRHLGVRCQVSGVKGRHETKPRYISEKNIDTNTLVVVEGGGNPALYKKEIELSDAHFIQPLDALIRANRRIKGNGISVLARVRYRQPLAKAILEMRDEKLGAKLIFDQPQKFVAPGQSAVFYRRHQASGIRHQENYEMLGGGVIV
ncbi:MAG: tRNA-specific 2-thiouridylase [Candidatus Liptonbacteria bacterium]|nr:tRNA-specific 2-thiouridylase [Candidatus Liptonbacteria bacterium]